MKKSKLILAGILAVSMSLSFAGCKSKDKENDDDERTKTEEKDKDSDEDGEEDSKEKSEKHAATLDISSCLIVTFNGYDGMGVAECYLDDELVNKIKSDLEEKLSKEDSDSKNDDDDDSDEESDKKSKKKKKSEETEASKANVNLTPYFRSLSFEITPNTDLKNGDEVTIKVIVDESIAGQYDIGLESTEIKKTVTGLKTIQSVDPFEGLSVKFSGSEEEPQIIIDNSGCSDFVRNFVVYEYPNQSIYANGENLTITAYWGSNFTRDDQDIYTLSVTTKDYPISGLNSFPKTSDGLDLSGLSQSILDSTNGFITDYLYNYLPSRDYSDFNFNDIRLRNNDIEVSNFTCVIEKSYFAQPKENTDNHSHLILLCHVNYDVASKDGATSTHVDTYIAGVGYNFVIDPSGVIISNGDFGVCNSNDRSFLLSDMTFEAAYNTFVSPYSQEYVVNELPSA